MTARVFAEVVDGIGSHTELIGRPGTIYWYANVGNGMRKQVDVCCPGCGQFVAQLSPDAYPLRGSEDAPTCEVPIHFEACCGWRGWLRGGVWIPTKAA